MGSLRKQENIRAALDSRNQYWQRVFLFGGWDKWSLGVEDYEVEAIKEKLKKAKKKNKKSPFKQRFKPKY